MQIDDEAAAVTADLRAALLDTLGEDLLSLVLYGSVVAGGFDRGVSDVDLIAVTAPRTDRLDLEALDRLHRAVVERAPAWDDRVEVVYVGREALAAFRATAHQLIVISPGEPLHRAGPARDWLQNWYLARTTGVPLVGPAPASVIPPIAIDEFLDGVRRYVRDLAGYIDGERSAAEIAYAVLSVARGAQTLATTAPTTKLAGAEWLRGRRPDWAGVIDEALATRLGRGATGFADRPLRERARALVREVAAAVRA